MKVKHLIRFAIEPALSLLPARMDSYEARRMLVAIALQESRARHRFQIPGRHARGYWQFERGGGIHGVITHTATKPIIGEVCNALDYPAYDSMGSWEAVEHNDVLAAVYARLLLWTLPQALPQNADDGWSQYMEAWRPGKPHQEYWMQNWLEAEEALSNGE